MLQFNPYTYHIDGEATRLYQRTRRRSQWHKLWAGLTRQLYQIRGSEGRANDFDLDFCPLHSHNRERWLNLARAWQQGVPIPPVDLIQIGDIYFARDGHHRISVARTLGQKEIEAMVIIFQLVETPAAEPKDRANTHPAIPTALPVPWQFLTEQL